jgi:membrane associated rhomboid family serine protease
MQPGMKPACVPGSAGVPTSTVPAMIGTSASMPDCPASRVRGLRTTGGDPAQSAFSARSHGMPLTLVIIAITCIVSWLAFNNGNLMQRLLLWPPAVTRRHEYWRLLTYGLVHADYVHLLFNMVTLFFFGRLLEGFFASRLGPFGFLWFYLGGLLVSILPTWLKNRGNPNYRGLGASGAVSAVLFAFILLSPWSTIIVYVLPLPAVLYAIAFLAYSIYMDRRGADHVNHSAHLWGAAYGIVFTVIMEPRVLPFFLQQLQHPHLGP